MNYYHLETDNSKSLELCVKCQSHCTVGCPVVARGWWSVGVIYSQTSLIRAPLIRFLRHPNGDPWEQYFLVHFVPSNPDTPVSESERIRLEHMY